MCPVVLVWEHLHGFSMGTSGSRHNGENLRGVKVLGEDYYGPGKEDPDWGFKRGKIYSGVVLY